MPDDLVRVVVRRRVDCDGWFVVAKADWESLSAGVKADRISDFVGGDLYVSEEPAEPGDRAGDQFYDDGEWLFDGDEEEHDG